MTQVVIVCGSRDWPVEHLKVIESRLAKIPREALVVEGGARGVDRMVAQLCRENQRPFMEIPAERDRLGQSAGMIRDKRMLAVGPNLVIAFTTGIPVSAEARSLVKEALREHVPVKVYTPTEGPFVFHSIRDLQVWEYDYAQDRQVSPRP